MKIKRSLRDVWRYAAALLGYSEKVNDVDVQAEIQARERLLAY